MQIQNPVDTDGDGNINDPAIAANNTTGNEFTYSTANTGVLTIPVRIQIRPDTQAVRTKFQNKVRIRLTAIDDSHTTPGGADVQLSWDNAYSGETTAGSGTYNAGNSLWEATATFTGLPPDNDDFGQKTVTVDVYSGTNSITTVTENYEVFFLRDAANHPGGQATDPNWFHYWGQVHANANVTYVPGFAGSARTPGMLNWAYNAAPDKNGIEIGTSHPGDFRSYGVGERFSGIDRYIGTVIHEEEHVQQIADADGLVTEAANTCFRYGWSWNQGAYNHWAQGPDNQWGQAGVDDDNNGTVDDAATSPPFEPGNGDDIDLSRPGDINWPNAWPLPNPNNGPVPTESAAINASDNAMNEHDNADEDWGNPGKQHLTVNRWDD